MVMFLMSSIVKNAEPLMVGKQKDAITVESSIINQNREDSITRILLNGDASQ